MIVERLKSLRNARKLSQKDFAQALEVSQQTVASWERGRTEPSNMALKGIADYFDVTTDYLLGRDSNTRSLSKNQINLLRMFDGLNDDGQKALLFMLGSLKRSHPKQGKNSGIVQANIGNGNVLAVGDNNYYKF